MSKHFEVFPGWREDDTELLPALRALYSYDERWPGRATGWLWSERQQGQLPPMDWPAVLERTAWDLLDAVEKKSGQLYTAAAYQAYLDGTGTGWHYDREWDCQAILSLGVTRTFGIRSRKYAGVTQDILFPAEHGDLLVMYPGCQDVYEHCVLEENVTGERVSVVFRGCYRPLAALLFHLAEVCGRLSGAGSREEFLQRKDPRRNANLRRLYG